jgi:DNA-binding CsgD family transcriptional regulator
MQTYLAQNDSHTLLGSLYDSVLAETGFQGFIEIVCRTFDLKSAAILVRHAETMEAKSLWQIGVDESWMESYALVYASEDLLAQHMAASPIAAFYASNLDIANPERFPETRFYREWIVPQGIAYAAGSIVLREGEWMTEFFVQRSSVHRPFSRVDLEHFNHLIPHVQRAIQMRQRFVDLRLGERYLGSVLDLLVMPTLLFDENGRIAHANAPANAVMKRREQYWEDTGHLLFSTSAMTRTVNLEVSKAIRVSRGEALECHGVVMLSRPDNVPLLLMITPLRLGRTVHRQGAALLFVFDPQATPIVPAEVVKRLFGLSEAEAELAVALCRGLTLEDAANERAISVHTTRSQLKSIFNKTGTKRQADLLSLLLTSPAFFLGNKQK